MSGAWDNRSGLPGNMIATFCVLKAERLGSARALCSWKHCGGDAQAGAGVVLQEAAARGGGSGEGLCSLSPPPKSPWRQAVG